MVSHSSARRQLRCSIASWRSVPGTAPSRGLWRPADALLLIAALFVLDALATALTVLGGGAGGLFIPLVTQGWLLGRFFEGAITTHTSVFPVVGAAAFLGAGYRTPIAAVMFVAESTGGPGFIVPALIATAIAQLVMGTHSISEYQRVRRVGSLELQLEAPVGSVLVADPVTSAVDTPLDDTLAMVESGLAVTTVPVVEDGRYRGMLHLVDLVALRAERVSGATVGSVMRDGAPFADQGLLDAAACARSDGSRQCGTTRRRAGRGARRHGHGVGDPAPLPRGTPNRTGAAATSGCADTERRIPTGDDPRASRRREVRRGRPMVV